MINLQEDVIEYTVIYKNYKDEFSILLYDKSKRWVTRNGHINDFRQLKDNLQDMIDSVQEKIGIRCKKIIVGITLNYFYLYNKQEIFTGNEYFLYKKNNEKKLYLPLSDINIDWEKTPLNNFLKNENNNKSPIIEEKPKNNLLKNNIKINNPSIENKKKKNNFIVHDCGKLFLIDGLFFFDNIENVKYNTLKIYESFYVIPQNFYDNICRQIKFFSFKDIQINFPPYLMCQALSENMNNDIILIDINEYNTNIVINHKEFTYNYYHINTGIMDFINPVLRNNTSIKHNINNTTVNNKINSFILNQYLKDIFEKIKFYSKATVIISGKYCKNFNIAQLLQRLFNGRIFYLDSLLSSKSNEVFFNLVHYYCKYLIPSNEDNDENIKNDNFLMDKISDIVS